MFLMKTLLKIITLTVHFLLTIYNLYEKDINIESLLNSPKFVNIEILKLLVRDKQLKELYQLSPTSSDNSLNAGVFSLNILFSSAIKKYRFLIFDYFVRISYLRNIIDYYEEGFNLNDGLIKDSGVLNDLVLRDIMNSLQINHYSAKLKQHNSISLIGLLGLKKRAKKSGLENRLDAVLDDKEVSNAQRVIGYLPCLAGEYLYTNESELFYSFYTLLSAIGEIVKRNDLSVDNVDNLNLAFAELSQIRYYSMQEKSSAERKREIEEDEVDGELESSSIEKKKDDIGELSELVVSWMNEFKDTRLATHQLGKSFTRFFVSLSNLMNSHNEKKLGRLFHLCLVNFLNSILVEDVRENRSTGKSPVIDLNHSNMVSSERIFEDNLKKVIENKGGAESDGSENLKFSKWIMQCPLLLSYLDMSKTDLIDLLNKFTNYNCSLLANFNVYQLLKEVSLQSKKDGVASKSGKQLKWKSDPSYLKKINFNNLYDLLKDDGFDMNLFRDVDLSTNTSNNAIIRAGLPLFKTSTQIRNFRKYLKEKNYFKDK